MFFLCFAAVQPTQQAQQPPLIRLVQQFMVSTTKLGKFLINVARSLLQYVNTYSILLRTVRKHWIAIAIILYLVVIVVVGTVVILVYGTGTLGPQNQNSPTEEPTNGAM